MLTRSVTKRIDLEHEPGEWIEVRMLGYVALERARQARSSAVIRRAVEMGPELLRDLQSAAPSNGLILRRDPVEDYDIQTLLHEGIVAWSYPEPVTPENIDSLDEQTAKLVARALVPTAETEEARKNAWQPSTGS